MKITVFGAGAVGGHIAGRLGATDAEVSVIARGATLAAMQTEGLRVVTHEGDLHSTPTVTDRPTDLGPQDLVIVAVKAPSLPTLAEPLTRLVASDGLVLFVNNGVPWWYFAGMPGTLRDTRLRRLDPHDALWSGIGPHRTAGGVAYTAGTVLAPGVIRAENPVNRLVVGRPDGSGDRRLESLATVLESSGLAVTVTDRIRDAVWTKLVSNTVGGALGTLTASATRDVLDKPVLAAAASAMAEELAAVARGLGTDIDDPAAIVSKLATSGHVQSVVQDLLAGRTMEVEALFRAPRDLATIAQVPTPILDLIVELALQRARATGQYPEPTGS